MSYLSMNVIIQTDGPVVLTKPPRTRRGELDLSSEEQTRILNGMQTRIKRSRESFELLVDECHHPNGRACGSHEAAANKKRRA